MNWRMVGLFLAAMGLLVAAAVIDACQLWSALGNETVPWFCSAAAIALLAVLATSLLAGTSPGAVPAWTAVVVVLGASIAVGVGMIVDWVAYYRPDRPADWPASVAEWLGFTIILVVAFLIPPPRRHREQPAATEK